jgi:prephenate dehydratase/chorismate mutase/prephenate dehydratase
MNQEEIRKKLNKIDFQILKLLDSRMELELKSKKIKKSSDDTNREKEFLKKIRSQSRGLIAPDFCEKLYTEITNETKKLKKNDFRLVAFQGAHGAYSEVAARVWDRDLIPIPCSEFSEIFEGIQSGLFDYGVVPVENSSGGVISQVNQLIISTNLYVVGAVELHVHHCLLTLPGTDYRELHAVYSHSQALEQCRQFIVRNNLEPIPYYDTAGSARMLAEEEPTSSAAIASKLAAEIYNLEVIKENIEDFERNITRFLLFSKKEGAEEGNKCSIIFSTAHKAGTLFKVLEVFATQNINLTRIESIPNRQGSYAFFLDFLGSKKNENVIRALEEVKENTTNFRLLGCYKERSNKDA